MASFPAFLYKYSVCQCNKKKITLLPKQWEFYFLVLKTKFYSLAPIARDILLLPLENEIHIFALPCFIFYILETMIKIVISVLVSKKQNRNLTSGGNVYRYCWRTLGVLRAGMRLSRKTTMRIGSGNWGILVDSFVFLPSLDSTWNSSTTWWNVWKLNIEQSWSNSIRCKNRPSKLFHFVSLFLQFFLAFTSTFLRLHPFPFRP